VAPRLAKNIGPRVQTRVQTAVASPNSLVSLAALLLRMQVRKHNGHDIGTNALGMVHVTRARVIRVYYLYKNLSVFNNVCLLRMLRIVKI
jgi:hypothetical protein